MKLFINLSLFSNYCVPNKLITNKKKPVNSVYTYCRKFSKFGLFLRTLLSHFWLDFTVVVYDTIYFEAYTSDQYILHKNNIARLYSILGRAKLCWKFTSWLRDAPNICRFPTVHFLLENLWISKWSFSILEKFQGSWAVLNIKYNFTVLFLCEMY